MANRLARESSPYLLLHAQNPVDWYPWGEEAFERARREEKPIFLSIGYSTCYWCHVMERESFSDPAIAREMNEGFVCVKVDREERPDVDAIYMTATQLITRSGGWPNSVFLTPELKPFFAGTYFPPRDASGRPGLPRVLQSLRQSWLFRRAEVLQQAEMVAQAMEQSLAAAYRPSSSLPGSDLGGELQRALAARFDAEWGGFGGRAEVPLAGEPRLPARAGGGRRGAPDAARDARPHGARRAPGPSGGRLPSLLDGRGLARAALREDAVRQRGPGLALRRGLGSSRPARASSASRARRSTSCCAS